MLNARDLYDEIKAALKFFGITFHQMHEMKVVIEKGHILFEYENRQIIISQE